MNPVSLTGAETADTPEFTAEPMPVLMFVLEVMNMDFEVYLDLS